MVNRGDVWWLEMPEEKRRPALVLTRQAALPVMGSITIAYLTRTIRGIPSEVRLGVEDGLSSDCVANLDNLRTVPRALLTEPVTSLSGHRMNEVCRALAIATGCD